MPLLKHASTESVLSTGSISHDGSSLNHAHTYFFRHSKSQLVSGAALVLLGHCIDAKYQEAAFVGADATRAENEPVYRRNRGGNATASGGEGAGGAAELQAPKPYFHSAPVKPFDRTEQKMMVDYANPIAFPEPDKANYGHLTCRVGIYGCSGDVVVCRPHG